MAPITPADEYVCSVFNRIGIYFPNIAEEDYNTIKSTIRDCYDLGFTESDAFSYVKCTEDVNPSLDEDMALKRMHNIGIKYEAYVSRCSKFKKE